MTFTRSNDKNTELQRVRILQGLTCIMMKIKGQTYNASII